MESLASTGFFAVIIAAISAALVVASILVARAGGPRRFAVVLLFAAALPMVIGLLVSFAGMMSSFQTIETLKAPTPRDLSAGVYQSLVCVVLGLAGSAVSGVAALVALLKSPAHPEPPTDSLADEASL